MTHPGGLKLGGFEDAIAAAIASGFVFDLPWVPPEPQPHFNGRPLVAGRNVFAQDMPETEELEVAYPGDENDPTVIAYDDQGEPTISLYTEAGIGVQPTASQGGRHETGIRFVLRLGTIPETAKEYLEDLIEWIEGDMKSRVTGYLIRSRVIEGRPRVFAREGDDHAYVDAVVRFLMVPTA